MEVNTNYEQALDLRDMLFHVLYRWRSCLCIALVCAVLLGAYQYISLMIIHNEGKLTLEELQYEIDLQKYYDDLDNYRTNIDNYTDLLNDRMVYKENSILMKIDPQNEWIMTRRYYVELDKAVLEALPENSIQDPADYVASVYAATLKVGLDEAEMEVLLGTGRRQYIDELVSVGADYSTNSFTIQIVANSEETVRSAMEYFVDRLEKETIKRAQAVAAHSLVLVSEDIISRTNTELANRQEELGRQIAGYQEAIRVNKENMNKLEDKKEPRAPGTHVKKFAAIGFIIGGILMAGIYLILYLASGKLHNAKDVSGRFNLPLYGEFPHSRAKHPEKGIDKWLLNKEFAHVTRDHGIITQGIAALLRENLSGKNVLMVSTLSGDRLNGVCEALKKYASNYVNIEAAADLRVDSEAVLRAAGAEAVIVVEEKDVSRTNGIEKEAEILSVGGANVVGCIVL